MSNFGYSTEDTAEAEEEQGKELEREDSGLDTNTLQDSNKIVHPFRGNLY